MLPKHNNIAEQNLIFAGLGLQLGILGKEQVIRAFTEWLFDKSKTLSQILLGQKTMSEEQAKVLKAAVDAHIQQEGCQDKALASLHMVKDLESDLDHLDDHNLNATLDRAVIQRKELGLDELFNKSHLVDAPELGNPFVFPSTTKIEKDRFERQQFFDAGNLGELYFANDTELNRTVVTKYIKPERASEGLTQALFHLEGEVTGALEHPGIVPVYGLGKDTKGRLFYAMRYIRGRKLSRVIADYHAIPKAESGKQKEALIGLLQNFQSACLALEYAHMKGVLHCDIKPDNIMIGDYGEVFVVDWGLVVVHGEAAKPLSNNEDVFATLEMGQIPAYRPSDTASSGLHQKQGGSRRGIGGTPAYMAPEQLQATFDDDVTLMGPPVDIYALGGTLFQILTGKAPHLPKIKTKERMEDFNKRILAGDFPKPRELKGDTPKALEAIVLKAMGLNPASRYASAKELADDVKRWMADEPTLAHSENLLDKSRRWARKNRTVVTTIFLLLMFLAMGGVGYGVVTQGYNEKLQISEKAANNNAEEAKGQRDKAQANEELANMQKEKTEQQLYINKIQRAQSEWNYGEASIAYDQLASIPFHRRHWEHDFLHTLLFNQNQVTLKGHTGRIMLGIESYEIRCVSVSRENTIVSVSGNNTIKVWDAASGMEIHTLKGHIEGGISSVAISADGKRIVSGSNDKTIKVWDAASGMEIHTLKGHTSPVTSVAISADGKRIVSGSSVARNNRVRESGDNTIKLWDAATGMEIHTLKGHTSTVYSVAISADGKRIVSGSGGDNTIKVWDAATGMEIHTLKGHSVAISADGKRIVSGSDDGTIKVWDAASGMEIQTLKGDIGRISNLAISADGKRIVGGSGDKTIKVWDAASGMEIQTLKGHTESVNSVAISADGKRIVSGSDDKTIKVWDAATGMENHTLKGHKEWVTSVAISADGKRIVSASDDKTIRVWDAASGMEIHTLKGHTGEGAFTLMRSSVSISADGKRIVSGSGDSNIKVWDAATGMEIHTLKGHTSTVYSVAISADGKRIVSGSYDKTIKVWDAVTGMEIQTLKGHTKSVDSVAITSDGKRIVSGGEGGDDYDDIKVWDAESGMEIQTLKGRTFLVTSVAISADGKRIVSGSGDKTIRVWDAATGMEIYTLKGHTNAVKSVAISADGKRIVSGSHDKTIKVWDATNGLEILTLKGHTNEGVSAAISADGKRIVSGSYDKTVKVWDATNGLEINILKGHKGRLTSVAITSDGKRIVSGSYDETIKVWDAATGMEIHTIKGYTGKAVSVTISADDKRIVSGSDNHIKIWDTASGMEIQTLKGHTDQVNSVAISADGKRIVSGSDDGTIKVWDTGTGMENHTLKGHTESVNSVAITSNGKRIVSGSNDKTIKVWDAASGMEIHTLKGHIGRISSVTISADDKRIVSGSDNHIKIWDTASGMEIQTLKGHTDQVNSVAISADGKRIVSGSDGTIKVWDIATGQEIPASHLTKDGYSFTSKGQISQDKQWFVDFNESDVVLINNKMRNERVAGDQEKLARWAKPDPQWHLFQATESEKANQWFAVAFHLRKLLEIEPANEDAKKRLQIAENNLKEDK